MSGIYGAGAGGEIFYRHISRSETISFFIDSYSDKKELFGLPVLRPSEINPDHTKIYNSVPDYEAEIKEYFPRERFVPFMETIKRFPTILEELVSEDAMWIKNYDVQYLNDNELKKVRNLLSDKQSIAFFEAWLAFRKNLDPRLCPSPTNTIADQYFPEDLNFNGNLFVDCGAFTGDTLNTYANRNANGTLIAFEPDPSNLKRLKKIAGQHPNIKTLIYPMGVYSTTTTLPFALEGKSSAIANTDNADTTIQVTSIDETVYGMKPDYIKMDIEGAEKEALQGARETIKDFTPNLAISIYHKPEDLWEIPILINEINPNYDFFIRCHNHLCLETVLYCSKKAVKTLIQNQ